MATDKIKTLLERYYAGDISPDDYETLLSEMKAAKDLPPELENECRLLLSVDSYEPTMPEGFEKMLSDAIDNRYRKSNNALRILFSTAAAAVVLICLTIGITNYGNKGLSGPEHIAGSGIAQGVVPPAALQPVESADGNEMKSDSVETELTKKTVFREFKEKTVIPEIDVEELDNAERIIDETLLNVLSMIHMAQNEVVESLDNIQINQTVNSNI